MLIILKNRRWLQKKNKSINQHFIRVRKTLLLDMALILEMTIFNWFLLSFELPDRLVSFLQLATRLLDFVISQPFFIIPLGRFYLWLSFNSFNFSFLYFIILALRDSISFRLPTTVSLKYQVLGPFLALCYYYQ